MNYKEYTVRVYTDGKKRWYNKEGQYHREDGPAIEWADGTKFWYIYGKKHREDGPAIEYITGHKVWCINDQELTETEFNALKNKPSCAGKTVIIDGKKYKLVEE